MNVGICPLYIDAVKQLALSSSIDLTLSPRGEPLQLLAKYCDFLIGFIPEGIQSNGTNHTLNEAKKMGKKITIIS